MKYLTTLILCLTFISLVQGQDLEEKIAVEACEYLQNVENINELEDSLSGGISKAIATVMMDGTDEERKTLTTTEGVREMTEKVQDLLPALCYNVRKVIIDYRTLQFYTLSDNKKANEYFDDGNTLMRKGKYKKALKKFKAATALDEKFVFAIDHTAICYRQLKDFDKAIKYYNESLEIFPEGDVALLNIAVVYSFTGDYDEAIEHYDMLAFLYPNNPEGYFGLARMLFLQKDYEDALDNLFTAHRMYVETDSDYVADSEKLLAYMMAELKELDKIDLVYKMAKKHDINIK